MGWREIYSCESCRGVRFCIYNQERYFEFVCNECGAKTIIPIRPGDVSKRVHEEIPGEEEGRKIVTDMTDLPF